MRKILILGFSCTAVQNSYANTMKARLESAGMGEVLICGLGGLTPPAIPMAIARMRQLHGPLSHVILEISTSAFAVNSFHTADDARDLAMDILHGIASKGTKIAIAHLFRRYDGPLKFDWNGILSELAAASGYPVVDLADGLVKVRGKDFVESLLRDEAHATDIGSVFQADTILDALAGWLESDSPVVVPPPPRLVRGRLSLAHRGSATGVFGRQDYKFIYAVIEEGETLRVELDKPVRAYALTFGFGLWGGEMIVRIDDGTPFKIATLDAHSRFERLGMRSFDGPQGRRLQRLTITQTALVPDVKLVKGTVEPGPRKGRVVDLLTCAPARRHVA